jgi:hypothetical protein
MITITKVDGMNNAQWVTEMALPRELKQVYGIIKGYEQARKARNKPDRSSEGRFQRLDESPWCCLMDNPTRHGTKDTGRI